MQFCQVFIDRTYWLSLLKVSIGSHQFAPQDMTPALMQRVRAYAGETIPPVLVLESGSLIVPAAVMQFARVDCTTNNSIPPMPMVPQNPDFAAWGIKTLDELSTRRVVSVGDLHGDMQQAHRVLTSARLVDNAGNWVGGRTIFVQTGDTIDRGPDTIRIMEWLEGLKAQAQRAGGTVILLNGNHELLMLCGDERYVSAYEKQNTAGMANVRQAFAPATGHLAQLIMRRPIAAQVGDLVFVHGGILPQWAQHGIPALNQLVAGLVAEYATFKRQHARLDKAQFAVFGNDGPLWSRFYATNKQEAAVCTTLSSALKTMGASRLVVGHTIQSKGRVHTRCKDKLVMQDVAISRAFGKQGGNVAFTEFYGNHLRTFDLKGGWQKRNDTKPHLQMTSTGGTFEWPAVQEPLVLV
jgi:hypothetical protein